MADRKRATPLLERPTTTPADSEEGLSPRNPANRQKTNDQYHVGAPKKAPPEIKVEERGMSVNQLIDILDIITERCNIERWTSTKDGMYC